MTTELTFDTYTEWSRTEFIDDLIDMVKDDMTATEYVENGLLYPDCWHRDATGIKAELIALFERGPVAFAADLRNYWEGRAEAAQEEAFTSYWEGTAPQRVYDAMAQRHR